LVRGYCEALPINAHGGADDTVHYLWSLHALHGFKEIFVEPPERTGVIGSLVTTAEAFRIRPHLYKKIEKLDFVRYVPETLHKYSLARTKKLEECIHQYLADIDSGRSGDDIAELRLTHIVNLYSSWVTGCELQAPLICSTPGTLLRPVSYLDSSGGIGRDPELTSLRHNMKLWFYTHLSNFDLELPFTNKVFDLDAELNNLNEKLGKTRFLAGKFNLVEKSNQLRDGLLQKIRKYAFRVTQFAKHNARRTGVVAASCAVTMLTGNLFALSPIVVEIPDLVKHIREDIIHKGFDSHFVFEPPPFVYVPNYKDVIDKATIDPDGRFIFSTKPECKKIPLGDGMSYIELRARQEAFFQQKKTQIRTSW